MESLQQRPRMAGSLNEKLKTVRQANSILGGAFVMLSFGFYLPWTKLSVPNTLFLTSFELFHYLACWHIAFIIGTALGAFLVGQLGKSIIYYITTGLIIISGALLIPHWNVLYPEVIARYIGGIAHGLTFITIIIHASEVAVPRFRGSMIVTISFYIGVSIFIAGMLRIGWEFAYFTSDNYFNVTQLYGIITVIYGAIGLVLNYFTTCESPVFLLQKNLPNDAKSALAKLRYQDVSSFSVNEEFADLRDMVNDERSESMIIFSNGNTVPVLRVAALRAIFAVSTTAYINWFAYALLLPFELSYMAIVYFCIRFLTEYVCMSIVDRVGRRVLLVISSFICGISFLIIGIICYANVNYTTLIVICTFMVIFGLALGLGLGPVTLVYMGEAFKPKKKPLSILFVVGIEHIVYILSIASLLLPVQYPIVAVLIAGVLQLVCTPFLSFRNTSNRTLRQAVFVVQKSRLFRYTG